jgi:uncharacterized integral membrane protein (TIGR00698 family)
MNHLILAILIGLFIGNLYEIPEWAESGIATHKLWLEAGIVVMGASVALDQVIAAGPTILALVVTTVIVIILLVETLSIGLFDIQTKVPSLLAAGSSICGVSAIVAVAGGIKANEREIAYAAATILLFDTITIISYPILGQVMGLSDTVFGVWAGLTMFSTGPVTAAGFTFSERAGEWAVIVKLTRNALIGVVAIAYSLFYTRRGENAMESSTNQWQYLWQSFPKFVLGFLFVMFVANIGILNQQQVTTLENASNWLFLFAFAGLGFEIQFSEIRSTGLKPIFVVLTTLISTSVVLLLILRVLF